MLLNLKLISKFIKKKITSSDICSEEYMCAQRNQSKFPEPNILFVLFQSNTIQNQTQLCSKSDIFQYLFEKESKRKDENYIITTSISIIA